MKYDVYFQFFKKKMKATIEADTPEQAEYILRGKIKVIKINPLGTMQDDMVDQLKDILGIDLNK